MRFDLTDLRLFVAVAEAGSITHGADRANMALPSASARIKGMEDILGTPLLERGRRGVTPTLAGRSLLHHARAVLRQVETMRAELGQFAGGLRGHVRLMSHTAALSEVLPEKLGDFLAAHPNIDIAVEERESRHIIPALLENRADLGVLSAAAIEDAGGPPLQVRPVQEDRLVVAVPKDHPLAGRAEVSFDAVADAPFIGLRDGSALQDNLEHRAAALGRTLTYRVRLAGFDAVCRVVGRGAGLAILPETAARRAQDRWAIALLPLTDPWAVRRLVVCARDMAALPLPARRLADHLAATP